MTAHANVRALRPMRVLLVTDDDAFADGLSAAAAERRVELVRTVCADDVDGATARHAPNVLVVDGRRRPRRAARSAAVSATLHPRVSVVLVADRAPRAGFAGIRVVEGAGSPERLLESLELARVGVG